MSSNGIADIAARLAIYWGNLAGATPGLSLQTQGVGRPLAFASAGGGSGSTLKSSYVEKTASQSLTTAFPNDGSIPQITEGDAVTGLTISFTPNDVNNFFELTAIVHMGGGLVSVAPIAIFVAGQTDAIALALVTWGTNETDTIHNTVCFRRVLGTTLPAPSPSWTFSVRAGGGANVSVNDSGTAPAQPFGAVQISSLKVAELAA